MKNDDWHINKYNPVTRQIEMTHKDGSTTSTTIPDTHTSVETAHEHILSHIESLKGPESTLSKLDSKISLKKKALLALAAGLLLFALIRILK